MIIIIMEIQIKCPYLNYMIIILVIVIINTQGTYIQMKKLWKGKILVKMIIYIIKIYLLI